MVSLAKKAPESLYLEYQDEVCGEKCLITVTHFAVHRGSYSARADSDWDYGGWYELEWEVLTLDREPWDELRERMSAEDVLCVTDYLIDRLDRG